MRRGEVDWLVLNFSVDRFFISRCDKKINCVSNINGGVSSVCKILLIKKKRSASFLSHAHFLIANISKNID